MSLHRRNPRQDDNAKLLVETLRRLGCSVQVLSAAGVPDAVVGFRQRNHWIEFKRPAGPKGGTAHSEQNALQLSWAAAWRGEKPWVLRTQSDCYDWVQARIDELADDDEMLETYCQTCQRLVPWLTYPDHVRRHPRLVDPG